MYKRQLVNNAGTNPYYGPIADSEDWAWDKTMDVNLRGPYLLSRRVGVKMTAEGGGSIINISSMVAQTGNFGVANYAASKAALIGFTKSVAKELAPRGITVNAIAPGFIETDMTAVLDEKMRGEVLERVPLGRFGSPDDIARAAVFLAMEPTGYVTGQVLTVDGGMVM